MSFRSKMIGITILSNDPSGGTKAIYCPPTIYRSSGSYPSISPPYSSLAGTAARCYIPHRYRYLFGLNPTCYFSDGDHSLSLTRAYSSSPSIGRSVYQPCSYGYLSNSSQGYYDPCIHGYLYRGVQRSSDPYGLEYLYSYRKRYWDPCVYGCSPSNGRRCYDPCVYNYPYNYGRSYYPSRGYTYRCGYSNDPCGYSSAPGYCQPCYAERRRYSCRTALSQKNIVLLVDLSTQSGLPYRADTSGPPKSSFGLLLKRPKESKNSYILDQTHLKIWSLLLASVRVLMNFNQGELIGRSDQGSLLAWLPYRSCQKEINPKMVDEQVTDYRSSQGRQLNTMHAGRLHSGWDHCYPNCSPMTMTVHPPPLTLSIMTPAQYSPGHPACIKPHNPCAPVHCWDGRSHYGYHGLPHSAAPYFTTPALPSPKCLPRSKSGYAPYRTY
ncbi:hypothetical protein Chor_005031 [Crotalus horridus]